MKKTIYFGKSEGFYTRKNVKGFMEWLEFPHIIEEKKGYKFIDVYMINKKLSLICNFYGNSSVIEARGKEEDISGIESMLKNEEKNYGGKRNDNQI
jgi:hypothetical protein